MGGSDSEAGYASDAATEDGAFPEAGGEVVDFGWEDGREVSGRRKKAAAAAKRRARPGTFEAMGLSEPVLRAVRRKGFRLPTPIQRRAMPAILRGADVVGMARTGSGKTAAFAIPLVERLARRVPGAAGARAAVLSPTRELAMQTHKVIQELARHTDLRAAALVGGDSLEAQWAELAAGPDVLVATPGRLAHHLAEVEGFSLRSVEYLVFDEADRLFEMGFAEQLRQVRRGF
jgi:ATP-dependent RNA helicase DDX54/DBP10